MGSANAISILQRAILFTLAFICPLYTGETGDVIFLTDVVLLAGGLVCLFVGSARSQIQLPGFMLFTTICLLLSSLMTFAWWGQVQNLFNVIKIIATLVFLPLVIGWLIASQPQSVDGFIRWFLAGAVLSAAIAILSRQGISLFGLFDEPASRGIRAAGLSYHPNCLGFTSAQGVLASIYLVFTVRSRTLQVLGIVCAGVCLEAIRLSGSRTAVLTLAVALLPFVFRALLLSAPHIRSRAIVAITMGLAGLFLTLLLSDDPQSTTSYLLNRLFGSEEGARASDEFRRQALADGWAAFLQSPLIGHGFEYMRLAHNHLVEILQCGGLLALAGLLIWATGLIRIAIGQYRATHHGILSSRQTRLVLDFAISMALVFAVCGALQPFLTDRNSHLFAGILLGLYFSSSKKRTDSSTRYPASSQALAAHTT